MSEAAKPAPKIRDRAGEKQRREEREAATAGATQPKASAPKASKKPARTVYEHVDYSQQAQKWEDDDWVYIRVSHDEERIGHFEDRGYTLVEDKDLPQDLPHIRNSRRRKIMRYPRVRKQGAYKNFTGKMKRLSGLKDAAGEAIRAAEKPGVNGIREGKAYTAEQIEQRLPEENDNRVYDSGADDDVDLTDQ